MNLQISVDGHRMIFKDKTYEIRIVADSKDFVSLFKEIEQAISIMKHLTEIKQISVVEIPNYED